MSAEAALVRLSEKYQVAAPRYTSYPTMPYWDTAYFNEQAWISSVRRSFLESGHESGISLYIHLPFCEELCTYCGCNTRITKNHRVEEPYIGALIREWRHYVDILGKAPIIREIHLGGGTPTFFSAKNLQTLICGLLEKATIYPDAAFSFEAHPANTSVEHLQTLFNMGFRRLSLGIQDFDQKVQQIINRRQSFEQVKAVTQNARQIGYTSINYDLIYGLPLQTLDGLDSTLKKVAELRPDRIAFYSYAHVPWLKPGQRKFTELDLPDPATKLKLYESGRSSLKSYGYLEVGMDNFALPGDELLKAATTGQLHRNFMGYTTHQCKLSIGLGVSAISDTGDAYAQNIKSVEEYLNITQEGKLPLMKGHLMTAEDVIIRRHILQIMCKGLTNWNHHTECSEAVFNGIDRLQPLADDGLIELSSVGLKVTANGESYLRNICMALDARLWAAQPTTSLFSMSI
ncbi:oxygen-independent coproporphyrinogen III oxidase [Mucilaginibacter ginkgonis]|uniref:Coproporphyrinogen-III oxidase n=1 Tax=Mucilaginibacter ginkgonis TaxID=2682091 RepID=A0A6I4HUB4_9SPHI|nr:oxygen-independent coproporphyrinogen III oxidase [Mucilaginibacter ginkgonis]QQL50252.1 oxygen-independent coproporphyrinogen III oxidase [Mucilaginibacter ginkgonis]